MTEPAVHSAPTRDLSIEQLYGILRVRAEVFIVEQQTSYLDPDGRDLEPPTLQFWVERDGQVVAALRLLEDAESGGSVVKHIGRVVTAPAFRGSGLASRLMDAALSRCGAVDVVLEAQAHLDGWYARFGFESVSSPYDLDGIAHVHMRRRLT